jgi:RHS repeat-associated protein
MSRLIRNFTFVAFSALIFGHVAIVLAQGGPPSKDRYIIVLKPAKNGVPELSDHDIAAGGGKVVYRVPGQVVVTLPAQAVEAMRKHGGVKYIQKVLLGPVPDASAPPELRMTPTTSSLRVAAEATPPKWSSGMYQYDTSGNIYAIGGVANDGSTVQHRYAYDELSRLKRADTTTTSTQTQTFTYDLYGNLIQQQIVGLDPVVTPVETTNTNRLAPSPAHPYTYDAAGNLTADYNVTYDYDPFNMLREKDRYPSPIRQEFYIYTASDERIGVTYGTATDSPTIWSIRDFSGNVLRQYKSYDKASGMDWLWMEDYVYRGGQLLAGERVPEEGGRRQFHLDHLGSPRLVTGQDSKEMSEHDFEPFGLESNYQETAGGFDREDPKRFTGHERDYAPPGESPASTAYLDYMHARYYTPTAGRFLSVDPETDLQKAQKEPQRWNRYAYVVNNPLRYTDLDGKETNPVSGGAGISDLELRKNRKNANVGKYGPTRSATNWKGGQHDGVDISAKKGTPLVAPVGGTVVVLKNHPKGGNVVFIDTVENGHTVRIGMAHMSAVSVRDGATVTEGQPVGASGDTGNAHGLPVDEQHVHLSVRIDGAYVDPQQHFHDNPPNPHP